MNIFSQLIEKNPNLILYHISSLKFRKYGKLIDCYNIDELVEYMENTEIPMEGNIYVPSVEGMEKTKIKQIIQTNTYGEVSIQIGYCNGRNSNLNALEYHKSSEINIAITNFILLLGSIQDIENNGYDVEKLEAFFVPKGTVVELFGTTLHFAPCKVDEEGFKAIVILPKGTNNVLTQNILNQTLEDELLFMVNKWLLAHPETTALIDKGAYPGIKGSNIKVNF